MHDYGVRKQAGAAVAIGKSNAVTQSATGFPTHSPFLSVDAKSLAYQALYNRNIAL